MATCDQATGVGCGLEQLQVIDISSTPNWLQWFGLPSSLAFSPFVVTPVGVPVGAPPPPSPYVSSPTPGSSAFDEAYTKPGDFTNYRPGQPGYENPYTGIGNDFPPPGEAETDAASLGGKGAGLLGRLLTGLGWVLMPGDLAPPALDERFPPGPEQPATLDNSAFGSPSQYLNPFALDQQASSEPNPFYNPDYSPDPYAEPTPPIQPLIFPTPAPLQEVVVPYVRATPIGDPFPYFAQPNADPFGLPYAVPQPGVSAPGRPDEPYQEIVVTGTSISTARASPATDVIPLTGLDFQPATIVAPFVSAPPRVSSPAVARGPSPGVGRGVTTNPFTSTAPGTATAPHVTLPNLTTVMPKVQVQPPPWFGEDQPPSHATPADGGCGQSNKNNKDKKSKKRQPRTKCFKGTYYERANGLLKFRKEPIQCR